MGVEILPGDGWVEVGRAVLHRQAVVVVAGPVQELHYIELIIQLIGGLQGLLKQKSGCSYIVS